MVMDWKTTLAAVSLCLGGFLPAAAAGEALNLPRQKVELVAPPFVHAHEQATTAGPEDHGSSARRSRKRQIVIDDEGTKFQAMTFNGSMPGPLMVVHEGDYVELTLVNPATNTMPHNIDFHSATGALGGGDADADQSGRAGHAALEGDAHGRVRLPLRARRAR